LIVAEPPIANELRLAPISKTFVPFEEYRMPSVMFRPSSPVSIVVVLAARPDMDVLFI
jgi:hypothetical protein